MPRGEDSSDTADYKTYWDNVKDVHQVSIALCGTHIGRG